ncbi:DUF6843 domain-containing protein [Domibacillus robiginosus]|uniref:DUF6843 domain-containing protein n=1 Tax=Domibacillus robiginosus TaxID=1071054 RepID=UPI00067D7263|nr:hypothetical protein [Domibacillus robiginosus]
MKIRFLVIPFTLLALAGCTFNDATNDIYLIPEGYEGYVYAFYHVKGAPEIKKEGDYEIHDINEDGYFATSAPDMDYGRVTDKYYYVDKNGQRTSIDKECIRGMGTGSSENDPDSPNKIHINYTGIEVVKNGCGQEFKEPGNGVDSEDLDSILSKVLRKYYGVESMLDAN